MQGMREMLLLCPDRPVRLAMRRFYLHLLGILAEGEGDRCENATRGGTKAVLRHRGGLADGTPYSTPTHPRTHANTFFLLSYSGFFRVQYTKMKIFPLVEVCW